MTSQNIDIMSKERAIISSVQSAAFKNTLSGLVLSSKIKLFLVAFLTFSLDHCESLSKFSIHLNSGTQIRMVHDNLLESSASDSLLSNKNSPMRLYGGSAALQVLGIFIHILVRLISKLSKFEMLRMILVLLFQPQKDPIKPLPSSKGSFPRDSVAWLCQGLVAAFTGLLTTSSVLIAFEFTAQKLFPEALLIEGNIVNAMALMV